MKEGGGEGERLPSFTGEGRTRRHQKRKTDRGEREEGERKVETGVDVVENVRKRK